MFYHLNIQFILTFFKWINLFSFELKGKGKRQRNINVREQQWFAVSCTLPSQGWSPKPGPAPWLGSKPATFRLWDDTPANWATPARTLLITLHFSNVSSSWSWEKFNPCLVCPLTLSPMEYFPMHFINFCGRLSAIRLCVFFHFCCCCFCWGWEVRCSDWESVPYGDIVHLLSPNAQELHKQRDSFYINFSVYILICLCIVQAFGFLTIFF